MARKEVEIKIEDGRDAGKTFRIVEMGAIQADKWVTKALLLLGKSEFNIGVLNHMSFEEILKALSKCDYEQVEKLLNELLACCSFNKDGVSVPMKGDMVDSVIEEWTTVMRLRIEALKVNLGFLEQDVESTSK